MTGPNRTNGHDSIYELHWYLAIDTSVPPTSVTKVILKLDQGIHFLAVITVRISDPEIFSSQNEAQFNYMH